LKFFSPFLANAVIGSESKQAAKRKEISVRVLVFILMTFLPRGG
jgi:hypothetical protein